MEIRCSSLDRVLNCQHSLRLPVEVQESTFASEGTKQHDLATKALEKETLELSDEMEDNTKAYVKFLHGKNATIETKLSYPLGDYVLSGTPDAYYFEDDVLNIVDLKNGFEGIDPLTNQLKGYALLVLLNFDMSDKIKGVKLNIFQFGELNYIKVGIKTILNDFKELLLNRLNSHNYEEGSHCRWCPSKIHCKKMIDKINIKNESKENMIELVRRGSEISKMIEESKKYLIEHDKSLFNYHVRKLKVWKKDIEIPTELVPITCAKAYKRGLLKESDYEIKEFYIYKLKEKKHA